MLSPNKVNLGPLKNHQYDVMIMWNTRKVKSLFRIKDPNPHPSCKIYEGICTCSDTYIGETKQNVEVRWFDHNNPKNQSEPAKHLRANVNHQFTWRVISPAPDFYKTRKVLEAFYICTKRPTLNDQLENELILFRNGITWIHDNCTLFLCLYFDYLYI